MGGPTVLPQESRLFAGHIGRIHTQSHDRLQASNTDFVQGTRVQGEDAWSWSEEDNEVTEEKSVSSAAKTVNKRGSRCQDVKHKEQEKLRIERNFLAS